MALIQPLHECPKLIFIDGRHLFSDVIMLLLFLLRMLQLFFYVDKG